MKKYVSGRGYQRKKGNPGLPEVENIELSEKNIRFRAALMVVMAVIGVFLIVYGIMHLLGKESGWQEITISSDAEMNCAAEFTLNYDLGASGVSAGTENRAIAELYGQASSAAYKIFNTDEHCDGVTNVYDINHNPNTELTVDPALYQAFEMILKAEKTSGFRLLYYGPLYETMENLYGCETDSQAKQFDPVYDETVAEDFEEVLSYANDDDAISLELLRENKVCLHISEDYLTFGQVDGIENYIDLYLMKNAFITDYIADQLADAGYTLGTLSSYDGYSRCLDDGSMGFDSKLFVSAGSSDYATLNIPGMNSAVSLRSFPLNELDAYRYYAYDSGEIRSPYLGSDGLCHTATANLLACSDESSCADLLLKMLPLYISDTMDRQSAQALASEGIYTAWCQDGKIISDIPDAQLSE